MVQEVSAGEAFAAGLSAAADPKRQRKVDYDDMVRMLRELRGKQRAEVFSAYAKIIMENPTGWAQEAGPTGHAVLNFLDININKGRAPANIDTDALKKKIAAARKNLRTAGQIKRVVETLNREAEARAQAAKSVGGQAMATEPSLGFQRRLTDLQAFAEAEKEKILEDLATTFLESGSVRFVNDAADATFLLDNLHKLNIPEADKRKIIKNIRRGANLLKREKIAGNKQAVLEAAQRAERMLKPSPATQPAATTAGEKKTGGPLSGRVRAVKSGMAGGQSAATTSPADTAMRNTAALAENAGVAPLVQGQTPTQPAMTEPPTVSAAQAMQNVAGATGPQAETPTPPPPEQPATPAKSPTTPKKTPAPPPKQTGGMSAMPAKPLPPPPAEPPLPTPPKGPIKPSPLGKTPAGKGGGLGLPYLLGSLLLGLLSGYLTRPRTATPEPAPAPPPEPEPEPEISPAAKQLQEWLELEKKPIGERPTNYAAAIWISHALRHPEVMPYVMQEFPEYFQDSQPAR